MEYHKSAISYGYIFKGIKKTSLVGKITVLSSIYQSVLLYGAMYQISVAAW